MSDGVDAITGVLATLELILDTFYSSLPINHFATSLLWRPKLGKLAHRVKMPEAPFPSWSWARWKLSSRSCSYLDQSIWARDYTHLAHVFYHLACDHKMRTPTSSKTLIIDCVELGTPAIAARLNPLSTKHYVTTLPPDSRMPPPTLMIREEVHVHKIKNTLYFKTTSLPKSELDPFTDPCQHTKVGTFSPITDSTTNNPAVSATSQYPVAFATN